MHTFFTRTECTTLARLSSKNLRTFRVRPDARASAGLKISGNSFLSCRNYDLVRKDQKSANRAHRRKIEKNSRGQIHAGARVSGIRAPSFAPQTSRRVVINQSARTDK